MKRTFVAFVALLTAAATVFVSTLATILPTAQQVTVTADPRYTLGDPAHAQGLRLVAETQMNGQLHWTTTFTPAQSPDCQTLFRFSAQSEPIVYQPHSTTPELSVSCSVTLSAPSGDLSAVHTFSNSPYLTLAQAVASRAPAGDGNYSETVTLRDYMESYPISVECGDWSLPGYAGYQSVDLSDVFSIPIHEDATAEVSVTVQPDGTISSLSFYAPNMPHITVKVVYVQGAFYVPFPFAGLEDSDTPPGLYRLPLTADEDNIARVDAANVELIVPLDAPAQATALVGNGPQLALVTSATQSHPNQLTLLDLSTGAQTQQFDLKNTSQTIFLSVTDDHIAYLGEQPQSASPPSTIMVWRREENGSFSPVISTPISGALPVYPSSVTTLLQGDTLYLLSHPMTWSCTWIYVAVYDPQGCRYAADLTLSQFFDVSSLSPVLLTDLRLELTPTK